MPGLLTRTSQFVSSPASARSGTPDGIWSKHCDSITPDHLQKFWSDLPLQARKELLKLDKQTLFEQARRNLYCSRCNGLLLEGFSQIMTYGKSLQQEVPVFQHSDRAVNYKPQNRNGLDEVQDPSLHPWGGLTTTKHGLLTVLDSFICARSLKTLKNVFDSARAREHERELLYPDACGGGGRGWISQGLANYGRGHGTRETCALHTARLSCDTLVDFWSALGEETRSSLLRMKEEDFIERLMYRYAQLIKQNQRCTCSLLKIPRRRPRLGNFLAFILSFTGDRLWRFDSKRFCRDCRKNVIREFKELKELKRLRKEPRCTRWFCVADSAFQYEVLEDTVHADWQQSFADTVGTYHHFEWALGTGEGQSDILEFEDVGLNAKVQVTGLDLGGLGACFITLRAWKLDGRCTELCVKAHALKGQDCVHRRLLVGDGFVTITEGDSIRKFFEHAEEAEEEEDDDAIDKDGNDLDGDGSRSQKHAKSPELAREFLLDAATVIFKEQVEKAFREGTARQNAHCIFVCLALKLLEERLHVACKEIITLEKQTKLLEEEEKEKREEEERKERRKTKEREKKLRRKERLKEKDKERERKHEKSKSFPEPPNSSRSAFSAYDESFIIPQSSDCVNESGDISILQIPESSDIIDEQLSDATPNVKVDTEHQKTGTDRKFHVKIGNSSTSEYSKSVRRKLRTRNDNHLDQACNWSGGRQCYINRDSNNQQDGVDIDVCPFRGINGSHRPSRDRFVKHNHRNCILRLNENCHSSQTRVQEGFDQLSCCCTQQDDYCEKDGYHSSMPRSIKEIKVANKIERTTHISRSSFRNFKYRSGCYLPEKNSISKGKHAGDTPGKEIVRKQVWEPLDARKKHFKSNSDPQITSVSLSRVEISNDPSTVSGENGSLQTTKLESTGDSCSPEYSISSGEVDSVNTTEFHEAQGNSGKFCFGNDVDCHNKLDLLRKTEYCSKTDIEEELSPIEITYSDPIRSSSSSDNCFSCLSEGDSSTSSSSAQNAESSVTSDSEDASQQSCGRDAPVCNNEPLHKFLDEFTDNKVKTNGDGSFTGSAAGFPFGNSVECDFSGDSSVSRRDSNNGQVGFVMAPLLQHILPVPNNRMHVQLIPPPTLGYHTRIIDSLPVPCNGFMPFPQVNHYVVPSHHGYGVPATRASDFTMHYSPVPPVNAPVFDPSKPFLHQTAYNLNVRNLKSHVKHPNSCGFQQLHPPVEPIGSQRFNERSFSNNQLPSRPAPAGQNHNAKHSAEAHNDHSSFSLFHFGGPVAGTTVRLNAKSHSLNDKTTEGLTYNLAAPQSCSEEEIKVEEYCLFSARNDASFPFL